MARLSRARARWSALLDGLSFIALTILVWGVNALQRGLWQDDVQALGEAYQRSSRSFRALFRPDPAPLRRLTLVPSAIANAFPHPIWALHVLSDAVWLSLGLMAGWIVGLLLPGRRWARVGVARRRLSDADGDQRLYDRQHGRAGVQRGGALPTGCRRLRAALAPRRSDRGSVRCIAGLDDPAAGLSADDGCGTAGHTVPRAAVRLARSLASQTPRGRSADRVGNRPRSGGRRGVVLPARSDELCGHGHAAAVEGRAAPAGDRTVARQLRAVALGVRAAGMVCASASRHPAGVDGHRIAARRIARSASRPHERG